jgi:hypothetical protein
MADHALNFCKRFFTGEVVTGCICALRQFLLIYINAYRREL